MEIHEEINYKLDNNENRNNIDKKSGKIILLTEKENGQIIIPNKQFKYKGKDFNFFQIIFCSKCSNKKLNKKGLFLLFIPFLLIIILLKKLLIKRQTKYKNHVKYTKPHNQSIFVEEKFDEYIDAFNKAKDFINNCMKGVLINTEKIKPSENPKISAVIPCHNCKEFLLRAIRSIQNQNFTDFEIVIVDDFSTDDSLSYIEKLQKEEPRIRIVKNKKNMGFLFSISIGPLFTKGKYIFPIDSDDIFLDKDVFSTISHIGDKGNFDIVLFDIIVSPLSPNAYSTRFRKDLYKKERIPNMVKYQPELGYYPIQPKESNIDINIIEVLINGRCVKSKIYKEAVNHLGVEAYSRYMNYDGDIIVNYAIFQTAKSMKYVAKYGYIYVERVGSVTRVSLDQVKLLTFRINMLDVLIKMSQNTFRHKKILIGLLNYILKKELLKDALNTTEYNKNLFNSCLDRILNCKYISNEDKDEIRKKGKILSFIKYNF